MKKCPACGKKVSDFAETCPNCGTAILGDVESTRIVACGIKHSNMIKRRRILILINFILLLLVGFLYFPFDLWRVGKYIPQHEYMTMMTVKRLICFLLVVFSVLTIVKTKPIYEKKKVGMLAGVGILIFILVTLLYIPTFEILLDIHLERDVNIMFAFKMLIHGFYIYGPSIYVQSVSYGAIWACIGIEGYCLVKELKAVRK